MEMEMKKEEHTNRSSVQGNQTVSMEQKIQRTTDMCAIQTICVPAEKELQSVCNVFRSHECLLIAHCSASIQLRAINFSVFFPSRAFQTCCKRQTKMNK